MGKYCTDLLRVGFERLCRQLVLLVFLAGAFGCAHSNLMTATRTNNLDRARELLEGEGAELVNRYTGGGSTPLIDAAYHGHEAMVELLIERGADPNLGNEKFGVAPLHWAATKGHIAVAEILLDNGAEVDIRDNRHKTPLHDAVRLGNEKIIRLLLDSGANQQLIDATGSRPADIAAKNTEVAKAAARSAEAEAKKVASENYTITGKSGRRFFRRHTGVMVNGRMVYDDPADFVRKANTAQKTVERWERVSELLEDR